MIKLTSHDAPKIVMFVVLFLLPIGITSVYWLQLCILSLIYALLTLSWNVINGYAGVFTFGHQAFFAIGAYVSALMVLKLGLSPWLTIWIGALAGIVLGTLFGFLVLRIRSLAHVAIMTLALAEIIRLLLSNLTDLTRGVLGLSGIPPLTDISVAGVTMARFGVGHRVATYYVLLCVVAIVFIGIQLFMASKGGLALRSLKEAPAAAESLGVNTSLWQMLAFSVSAAIAGLAGALYAHYIGILTPESVGGVDVMITILVMTLIGGLGTTIGPIIGAFVVVFVLELLRGIGEWRLTAYGVLLILIVMANPKGIGKMNWRDVRQYFAKKP